MGAEHEKAEHLQIVLLPDLPHGEEVAQGLGHLLIINVQKCVVHPVVGKGLAVGRLALGDLILVVGEDQVLAAGVDVDLVAQIFLGHHRALDVPAGAALAPRGLPVRLPLLLRLPEHEVGGILLSLLAGHLDLPESRLEIVQILVGQLAVILELLHAVVDGAVLRPVGVPLLDQGLDHLQHAADLLRGQGMGGGGLHIHGRHVLLALRDVALGNRVGVHPLLDGFLDDLVVHVGKIGHVIYLVALVLKVPAHRVKHDRGAADVHLHLSRLQGHKLVFSSGQCIINFHNVLLFSLFSVRGSCLLTRPSRDSLRIPRIRTAPSGHSNSCPPPWSAGRWLWRKFPLPPP